MKGYSSELPERCAKARLEDVNASYKDLSAVCGVLRRKKADWAVSFLEKAASGEVPVLYRRHNTNSGHRRELGGRKGRYPVKAAALILKALKSAMANGKVIGLGDPFVISAISANKKQTFPRMAPKGRTARSYLETSRVEIVLTGSEVPKGVSVTAPKKKEEAKKEEKKSEEKKSESKTAKTEKKDEKPETKEEQKPANPEPARSNPPEHKHEAEKTLDEEKKREGASPPHAHGEYQR